MSKTVVCGIRFKSGLVGNLPQLAPGEPAFTLDTHEFFVGGSDGVNRQIGAEVPITGAPAWGGPIVAGDLAQMPGEMVPQLIKQGNPPGPPAWWPQLLPGELGYHSGRGTLHVGPAAGAPMRLSVGPIYELQFQTTDITVRNVLTLALANNTAYGIFVRVTAIRTGGSAGAPGDSFDASWISVSVRNVAGVASFIGGALPGKTALAQDGLNVGAALAVSGGSLVVQFNGDTNTNYSGVVLARVENSIAI